MNTMHATTNPKLAPQGVDETDALQEALEVSVVWGDSTLHVEHMTPPRSFCVGDAFDAKGRPATDFLIDADTIGASRLPVTVERDGAIALVVPAGAYVSIIEDDRVLAPQEVGARLVASSALAGGHELPLQRGTTAQVAHCGFTFVARLTPAARRIGVGSRGVAWKDWRYMFAAGGLHLLLIGLMQLVPPRAAALSIEALQDDSRYIHVEMLGIERDPAEPDLTEPGDGREPDPEGQREAGDEGQAGKRDAEPTKKKLAVKGPPDTKEPVLSRAEQMASAFTGGVIGTIMAAQQDAPTSIFGAQFAIGRDPIAALGALTGKELGDSFGIGGLGMRGTGHHGGGDNAGTIGVGQLGTVGGENGSGYGSRAGTLERKGTKVPKIRMLGADVRGSLSKEVIRRIIHRHLAEVRHCYQEGLRSRPDLEGRVAVKFIIAPTGAVQAAAVGQSSLGNANVERCISTAVKRWSFPAPEGGGIVAVSYPFVLEHTGG